MSAVLALVPAGLLALLALLAGIPTAAAADDHLPPVDAAIVLAVDASGSVDAEERVIQRDGYADALRHTDLMRAITAGRHGRVAFSYFEWAGFVRTTTLIPWRVVDGPESAAALASEIAGLAMPSARGTSIARAIEFGTVLVDDDSLGDAKRIIDISADGPNNIGPPVTEARDRALARGITVNGLPILVRPSRGMYDLDVYFADCVIGGDGAFLLAVRTREELAFAIRRKLILEVSGGPPETVVRAAEPWGADCLIGERLRGRWQGEF
jgi:hypothetical protein